MRACVPALLALLCLTDYASGHGWLQGPPYPMSGGGPTQENASTQGPCGKTTSSSVGAVYAQGQQITLTSRRGGGHGEGLPQSVYYSFSPQGWSQAGAFDPATSNASLLGQFDFMYGGTYVHDVVLPADALTPLGATGEDLAFIQFHWAAGDGGNWYDCLVVQIVDSNDYCTDVSGQPSQNNCDMNAICENKADGSGFTCTCMGGYAGDGVTNGTGCADVDECATDPCDGKADCGNLIGDYSCTCKDGYKGDGAVDYCFILVKVTLQVDRLDFNGELFTDSLADKLGIAHNKVILYTATEGEPWADGSKTTIVEFSIEVPVESEDFVDEVYDAVVDGDSSYFSGHTPLAVEAEGKKSYEAGGEEDGDKDDSAFFILIAAGAGGVGLLLIVAAVAGVFVYRKRSGSSGVALTSVGGGARPSRADSAKPLTDNYSVDRYGNMGGGSRPNSTSSFGGGAYSDNGYGPDCGSQSGGGYYSGGGGQQHQQGYY